MIRIITTIHDPDGLFIDLIKQVNLEFSKIAPQIIAAKTENTSLQLTEELEGRQTVVFVGGLWGQSRKEALEKALEDKETDWVFACDFDKILHWLLIEKLEFESILSNPPHDCDFKIFGRGEKTFSTYPNSWFSTESHLNYLVSKVLKIKVDTLAATFLFNREVGEYISKEGREESWGACVEWPLLAHQASGRIAYQEANGLTFEDPDRCQKEIEEAGGLEDWLWIRFDNPTEWAKRFNSSLEQSKVVERFWKRKTT